VHLWYSIYVVSEGSVAINLTGEEWVAGPGSVVLLAPFQVHAEHFDSTTGCTFHGVYPLQRKRLSLPTAFVRPVVEDRELAESVRELRVDDMAAILRKLYDAGPTPASDLTPPHDAVRRAKDFIDSACGKPPSVADVAAAAGLSRFHLSRVFRDAVGLSPYAYVEQVRLARARFLLHNGNELSCAALETGFSDQSHLTRTFSEQVSTTPGKYARAVRAARRIAGADAPSISSAFPPSER
jgi:AraC-like DNA-binding protein